LTRDHLGLAPLYYGRTTDGHLCFASEVKALLELTRDIREFPPGSQGDDIGVSKRFELRNGTPPRKPPDAIAKELRRRLENAIRCRIFGSFAGCWLSGGLDSSSIAALARPYVDQLHTFAVGLRGAADLEFAQEAAAFLRATHHELVVDVDQLLAVLPKVIYSLESFDALLVRSSLTNYMVGELSSRFVPAVFSGVAGDELFAGYEYLKSLPAGELSGELIDITKRLHNTAFQRVDRSASSHGIVAHVPFADGEVVEYATHIPVAYKLHEGVEKWILRRAVDGLLPDRVLQRTKSKFWQGTGLGDLLARHAEEHVTDDAFERERVLANGWTIHSKEELLYYRAFREQFGELSELSWMGRTKGAPQARTKNASAT
jgi:asparagine synthase (glutamine-hydrolysing)